jgi:RNA polymerase sigma factor FliA
MYPAETLESSEDLVERHMDLVKRIAYHLAGRLPMTIPVQDLIQAGAMGLLEAAQQYDKRHGASFETYAGIRIRGAMLDEARRLSWAPRSTHRSMRQIGEAVRAVELRVGRSASAAEVAQELGVDLGAYHDMLRKVAERRVFNLEDLLGADNDGGDTLPGDAADPADEYLRSSFHAAVAEAIVSLPEREKQVLSMYYDEELNLREIGEVLGVTESRVCQIHGQALVRLRSRLAEWNGGPQAP